MKILWVEEEAFGNMRKYRLFLIGDDSITLTIAGNVKKAKDLLAIGDYEIILIDIRIPSGENNLRRTSSRKTNSHRINLLGEKLALDIYEKYYEARILKIGLFTNEIEERLSLLKNENFDFRNNYKHKKDIRSGEALMNFLNNIRRWK